LLGILYVTIYKKFNLSIYGFLIIIIIGFILALLTIYKIDKQVYDSIPEWVDKNMIPSIQKKQNTPLYIKICSLYTNSVVQSRTFISWSQLEDYLDILITNIKKSGHNYDVVVGIKTGGAIISDYISYKLEIPNYKIKLSREEYNCNKKYHNVLNDIINERILNKESKFNICEGINDNLQGKNIILIDELVSTGKTMEESYNYLKKVKDANIVYPACISHYKLKYRSSLQIDSVLNGTVLIWPWGYDN
jgi:hypoxanthine phosphoribosyltransferase